MFRGECSTSRKNFQAFSECADVDWPASVVPGALGGEASRVCGNPADMANRRSTADRTKRASELGVVNEPATIRTIDRRHPDVANGPAYAGVARGS